MLQQDFRSFVFHLIFNTTEILSGKDKETSFLEFAPQVLGRECEVNPPYLVQTSAWGDRLDHIETCPAWKKMKVLGNTTALCMTYDTAINHYCFYF